MTPRPLRFCKILVAVVTFLVTLELVLQVGAMVAAWFVRAAAVDHTASVLCVGDSFTFGVGATSAATSYPGQLAAALSARGIPDVRVANAGFPGQHSGDVLRQLASQLTPATKVLCVLVGANDAWRHPARVDPAELARAPTTASTGAGFQWRWRTALLCQLLTRFEANGWQQSAAKQPTTTMAAPPVAAAAATAADTAAGFTMLAKWGLATGNGYLGRYEPDRSLSSARNAEFARCMQAGDFAQALDSAEQSAREQPDSPLALQHVVTAAARTGQRDKAMAAVDRLNQLQQTQPSAAAIECLAEAYVTSGQPELAITTARQRIAAQPLSIMAWDSLQRAAFSLGRREDAMAAMAETIRLLGRKEPAHSAFIARKYASWWQERDPDQAIGLLLGAHCIDANVEETRIALLVAAPSIERRQFAAAMTAIGQPERAPLRTFAALLDEVYADQGADRWGAVLREHLLDMHTITQRRGIHMVILGYPHQQQLAEPKQREAAQSLGVPFVPLRERFERELRSRPREDLFVEDGHCNDAGYAIIAELVAVAVAPLLAK